jgi:ribosomal protein S18 acetylase RimI-like enzyme
MLSKGKGNGRLLKGRTHPMPYQAYSHDVDSYELSQGYALQRAQNSEFVKAWVVYRNLNEDFSQSFAETQGELEGVPVCFWVELNARRVAGMVMLPNGIGDFFLIPPENNAYLILSLVMPLLEYWSDEEKDIIGAQAIASPFVQAFQQFGFTLQESRFWMIRPTGQMTMNWSSAWSINPLDPEQAQDIALLLKEAFAGGTGQYAARDLKAHLASVNDFFDSYTTESTCGQASALALEKQSGKLAGVCMVDMHKNLPTIRFVAVHPTNQRRGLATNLMKRAISMLAPNYDWVKLAVTVDNPAVTVYRRLGFLEGDTLHQLSRPVQMPTGS